LERRPFKVFVSSPVDGIVDFRQAVSQAAAVLNSDDIFFPRYHVFLYEEHENRMKPGMTISQSIASTFGDHCDAFIVFFRDRIGNGTLEEFTIFESHFRLINPACRLWWSQINCENTPDDVHVFRRRLLNHATEMKAVRSQFLIETPDHLKERIIVRLASLQ
jgi:hypothetical protein